MKSSSSVHLADQAFDVAQAIVRKNITARGLVASVEGYPQVWARDSMITFLGAAIDRSPEVMESFRISLESLVNFQDRFGQIPFLVHISDGSAQFGSSDANPWFVIGSAYYARLNADSDWISCHADAIVRALDWCEAQDLDKGGLMHSGEACDWADLMANHGRVLFPNVLYAHALRVGSEVLEMCAPAKAEHFRLRLKQVQDQIQNTFWVKDPESFIDDTHEQVRKHISVCLRKRPYFLPWVGSFDYGDRFDTTANLLAVLTGVASAQQADQILDYVDQTGLNRPYPVRVLYPPVLPGDPDWREYYRIYNLNLPDQYHNGGIWPWVGGLYVAALVKMERKEKAREELERLAGAIKQGKQEWECNEWLHGQSGVPMGIASQAWSAGLYLYAYHAVKTGETPGYG